MTPVSDSLMPQHALCRAGVHLWVNLTAADSSEVLELSNDFTGNPRCHQIKCLDHIADCSQGRSSGSTLPLRAFRCAFMLPTEHLTAQSITCQEQERSEDTCVLPLMSLGKMATCREAIS